MHNQDDQGALQEGTSDTQTDGVLQLRLDNAKLMRSEAALRAKSSSLEEALKGLEARLSEYEAQAMTQHAALEHGKHQVCGYEAFGRNEGRFSTSALCPKCCTHDQTVHRNNESAKQLVWIWHTHSSVYFPQATQSQALHQLSTVFAYHRPAHSLVLTNTVLT